MGSPNVLSKGHRSRAAAAAAAARCVVAQFYIMETFGNQVYGWMSTSVGMSAVQFEFGLERLRYLGQGMAQSNELVAL
jgi:hypothetical protein